LRGKRITASKSRESSKAVDTLNGSPDPPSLRSPNEPSEPNLEESRSPRVLKLPPRLPGIPESGPKDDIDAKGSTGRPRLGVGSLDNPMDERPGVGSRDIAKFRNG
jgi:hypothetical protein